MIPRPFRALSAAFVLARVGAAFVTLMPGVARASEALEVASSGSLDGDRYYATVTIKASATLKVNPWDGTKGGLLHLYANKIVVEAGGVIDASAAGYPGMDSADGMGPGGGKAGPLNLPGGGGAFGGDGGEGYDASCVVATMLLGGAKYATPPKIDFGSAGGAAGVMSVGTSGGRGGGAILLEAAEIDLSGSLLADGAEGTAAVGRIGLGGGGGGMILIRSNKLVIGAGAKVSARGGRGGGGAADQPGGGGGGGVVVVNATLSGALAPDVSGGAAGSCAAHFAGSGQMPAPAPPVDCLDLDGDGAAAALCGGDDCDDSDKAIHPGAAETCDGVDNDCDGTIDDNLVAEGCPSGFACRAGGCAAPSEGSSEGSAGGDAVKPEHLALAGGCAIAAAPSTGALAIAAAAIGMLAARRSRRRAASSKQRVT